MAYVTRQGGTGWTYVQPYSNYGYTVQNYASALASAQAEQQANELEHKVFLYRNGNLTYNDLINYINSTAMSGVTEGSAKDLQLKQLLVSLDAEESNKQMDIKRAELESQFAKGGISADEKAKIEEALLGYVKPGTVNYSEQLANISAAKEAARVEANNAKVAALQSSLSSGGLTTSEQIRVYEEMGKYAEKGSQDAADIQTKIGELTEQKKAEDRAAAINQRYSDLMDKYSADGSEVTTSEYLDIVRNILPLAEKGTKEYIDLKEQESDLLRSIASEAKSGAKSSRAMLEAEYSAQQAQLEQNQADFESGKKTLDQYVQSYEGILSTLQPQDYAGILTPEDEMAFREEKTRYESLKQAQESGNLLAVKMGNKYQPMTVEDAVKTAESGILTSPDGAELGEQKIITVKDPITGLDTTATVSQGKDGTTELQQVQSTGVKAPGAAGEVPVYSLTGKSIGVPSVTTSKEFVTPKMEVPKPKTVLPTRKPTIATPMLSKITMPKLEAPSLSSISGAAKDYVSSKQYGSDKILGSGIRPGVVPGTVDIGITEAISSAAKKAKSTLGSLFKKVTGWK